MICEAGRCCTLLILEMHRYYAVLATYQRPVTARCLLVVHIPLADLQGAAAVSVVGSLQKSPKVPYHDTMHPLFWERGAYGHVNLTKVVKLIAPAVAGHLALILQGIGLQFTSGENLHALLHPPPPCPAAESRWLPC